MPTAIATTEPSADVIAMTIDQQIVLLRAQIAEWVRIRDLLTGKSRPE